MKKVFIIILTFFLMLLTSCSLDDIIDIILEDDPVIIHDDKQVNILSINDTHGASISDESTTGLDKVQSVIETLEEQNGKYIKIANGDIYQGGYLSNATNGLIMVDMLNKMNFDCFVIGNHEFDWGLDKIALYKDGDLSNGELNCKYICCNIVYKATNERPSWIDEYEIVENHGYKVGIIGAIGASLESSISSELVQDYNFINPDERIKELSKELRNKHSCDLVILSIHEYNQTHNEEIASFPYESRIDGIICGHSHQKINEYEKTNYNYQIPVVQNYNMNGSISTIVYTLDEEINITNTLIKHYEPSNYPINQIINNIKNDYESLSYAGEEVIFTAKSYLSKEDLGIMIAKSMEEVSQSDIAFLNVGGTRTSVSKGKVRMKDILEIFPFDNNIYVFEMSGYLLDKLIKENKDYLYLSKEINIDTNKKYKVATIDFIFNKKSYNYYFKNSNAENLPVTARENFISYLKTLN